MRVKSVQHSSERVNGEAAGERAYTPQPLYASAVQHDFSLERWGEYTFLLVRKAEILRRRAWAFEVSGSVQAVAYSPLVAVELYGAFEARSSKLEDTALSSYILATSAYLLL
ncbi:hypothetical protein [Pyrobaculum sp.]|uniref:hypothetical protein n=1 Tax=Pyrobaculum sp. TaxID=2004705 RepID=UPI003D0DF9C0